MIPVDARAWVGANFRRADKLRCRPRDHSPHIPFNMRRRSTFTAAFMALVSVSPLLPAQELARTAQRPAVRALLDSIKANNAWTLQQQVSLCEIPAPPFKEQARGQAYKAAFEKLG